MVTALAPHLAVRRLSLRLTHQRLHAGFLTGLPADTNRRPAGSSPAVVTAVRLPLEALLYEPLRASLFIAPPCLAQLATAVAVVVLLCKSLCAPLLTLLAPPTGTRSQEHVGRSPYYTLL
ncbi:hypothetical protein NDU88_011478 [Pleurodeles waltl]|uniref:Uncharacterized protein n=1 Tax=Pleurodeles waltl TaxID=8319 RepID=A0AAV7R0G2_PLEWA|nr:hypothetical protein NDU88_011478 [Pleurodeles waltl]